MEDDDIVESCRPLWSKRWIWRRTGEGAYGTLLRELNGEDPECFQQCHRLDRDSFNNIHALVGLHIVKSNTNRRYSIGPGERLSVTLRFLASGKFLLLAYPSFKV